MNTQIDQIIPMKKISDEHEYTQNPMAREFHKENGKDYLSLGSMIQEKMEEQTTPQEVPIEAEETNLQKTQDTPILGHRAGRNIPIDENNCSQNSKTQENEKSTTRILILVEETSVQKVQDIPVIHVTTKEDDLIFQISVVDDPQEAQVINELNRDPEARDYQEYICEEFLNLDSAIHEETKESSLEDSGELNVNPKEDPSPQKWMKELEPLNILRGPSRAPSLDFLADPPIWDEELSQSGELY
ncbi:hypothetical protein AMTRI_Chr13g122380 [Amborella trichopoda]